MCDFEVFPSSSSYLAQFLTLCNIIQYISNTWVFHVFLLDFVAQNLITFEHRRCSFVFLLVFEYLGTLSTPPLSVKFSLIFKKSVSLEMNLPLLRNKLKISNQFYRIAMNGFQRQSYCDYNYFNNLFKPNIMEKLVAEEVGSI